VLHPVSFKPLHLFNLKEQGQYLVGLIPGDGHFTKYTCRISFDQLDRVAMENLTVCFTKNTMSQVEAMTYAISFNDNKVARQDELIFRNDALKDLLRRVHGHFIGDFKISQIVNHKLDNLVGLTFKLLNNIPKRSFWLSGFLNAEGSILFCLENKHIRRGIVFTQKTPELIKAIADYLPTFSGDHFSLEARHEIASYRGLNT
jgi:hypothetical protein